MMWPVVTLDSIKANVPYAFVGGPFGSNLTSKHYVDEGVPVIRGQNLSSSGPFDENGFVFVTPEKADQLRPNTAFRGDILFTQRGTLGQVGLIPHDSLHERYVVSQSQMKLTVDAERVDARYVYQYFRLPSTVQKILNLTITAGVPHINLGILKSFEMPLPPLPVQRRIALIAQAYDDLIDTNQRRIQLLEDAARRLYREWFVNLRFPGYEPGAVKDGVPKGWRSLPLTDVADFINGFAFKPAHQQETGLPIVKIPELRDGVSSKTPSNPGLEVPLRNHIDTGDVLFSWSATLLVNEWSDGPALLNQHLFKVVPKNPTHKRLVRFAVEDAIPALLGQSVGATMQHIRRSALDTRQLLVPDNTIAEAFSALVDPMMDAVLNLQAQNRHLASARDALLPKLMSGQFDVSGIMLPEEIAA